LDKIGQHEEKAQGIEDQLEECSKMRGDVQAMQRAGIPFWQGIYKCYHSGKKAPVWIKCGMEGQDVKCWIPTPEEMQQAAELMHQNPVENDFWNELTGAVVKTISNITQAATEVLGFLVPPSKERLHAAIEAIDDDEVVADLKRQFDARWHTLTPFQQEFAIVTIGGLHWVPARNDATSALQVSENMTEKLSIDAGENFWQWLVKIINAICENHHRSRGRAAYRNLMKLNMGHEWTLGQWRREGWRFH
jgi:hypothetical protein